MEAFSFVACHWMITDNFLTHCKYIVIFTCILKKFVSLLPDDNNIKMTTQPLTNCLYCKFWKISTFKNMVCIGICHNPASGSIETTEKDTCTEFQKLFSLPPMPIPTNHTLFS